MFQLISEKNSKVNPKKYLGLPQPQLSPNGVNATTESQWSSNSNRVLSELVFQWSSKAFLMEF